MIEIRAEWPGMTITFRHNDDDMKEADFDGVEWVEVKPIRDDDPPDVVCVTIED